MQIQFLSTKFLQPGRRQIFQAKNDEQIVHRLLLKAQNGKHLSCLRQGAPCNTYLGST